MFNSRQKILIFLAAFTWFSGAFALMYKAYRLLAAALLLDQPLYIPAIFLIIGISAGLIKYRYIFKSSCLNNISRIQQLQTPKYWQFFRGRFFVFLGLMIVIGMLLSRLAAGNYYFLQTVAALDISIATALFFSGTHHWQH